MTSPAPADGHDEPPGPPPGFERLETWLETAPIEEALRYFEWCHRRVVRRELQLGEDRAARRRAGRAIAARMRRQGAPAPVEVDGVTYLAHRDGNGLERYRPDQRGGPKP